MSIRAFLQSLTATPARRERPGRAGRARRLAVESLEDRSLPSTFTVVNLLDSGAGSLRAAVAAANASPGADAVDFAVTGTIALTGGQLDLTDDLTIRGPGVAALTVSGNHTSRVFRLAGTASVAIADLTIADGHTIGSPGGGISLLGGSLALARVAVSGNVAAGVAGSLSGPADGGGAAGGGVYVAGGTLTLDSVAVSGNVAIGGSGYGGYAELYGYAGGIGAGGGIYVAGGTVVVNQSTISGNLATGGAGGDSDEQYWVGWENTYGGNGGGAAGGGVRVAGGAVEFNLSAVSGNTAAGGAGGSGTFTGGSGQGVGGGLDIAPAVPPRADLDAVTESHTVNNIADSDPDIAGPYSLNGSSPPSMTISDVTVAEGNTGTRTATFTVTLSAASTQPVSATYATAHGTATSGDYTATSGGVTFAPGETSKTFTIQVTGDRLPEPSETFFVNLGSPTNATIADGQGVGTIVDDEPRISIGDVSKAEGRRGRTTLFTFTVTLSAAYDQAVTMSFRTVNGTATTGDGDYVAKTGTLTFAPGETTKTVTIEVKGDSKRETNEYFYLDLSDNSGNSLFTKNRGTGTIFDDD